jgi:hypothetical protein
MGKKHSGTCSCWSSSGEGWVILMPARNYLMVFILSLIVLGAVASFQTAPGYMDADYYYSGGAQLASGHGFQENFLWNYLDDPTGTPHPSHTYWMPLASLLAAILPALAGKVDFFLARIPFILIGALAAPVTAGLSYHFTRRSDLALFAGALAVFPGYYLPYLVTTDTFGIFMLLGSAFFALAAWLPAKITAEAFPKIVLLGMCAGLMHLARADGLLWLGFAWVIIVWIGWRNLWSKKFRGATGPRFWDRPWIGMAGGFACATVGYLAIMSPWLLRNLALYGAWMSPGSSRVIWQREYDELFSFPAGTLQFTAWWAQGLGVIVSQRLNALAANLGSTLGVQWEVLLTPFALTGLWKLRKQRIIQFAVVAWGFTILVMSFVYPFAGARGGFFHSGSAVQPVIWAVVPCGFESILAWAARARRWTAVQQASRVFASALGLILVVLTGYLCYHQVIGSDVLNPAWNRSQADYRALEMELRQLDPSQTAGVLVNNPAGYSLVSNRPAYVIPNGDITTLLAVAHRYDVRYVLLDRNFPAGLAPVYANPHQVTGLVDLTTIGETDVFQVPQP